MATFVDQKYASAYASAFACLCRVCASFDARRCTVACLNRFFAACHAVGAIIAVADSVV
jgi:hypothetical protein